MFPCLYPAVETVARGVSIPVRGILHTASRLTNRWRIKFLPSSNLCISLVEGTEPDYPIILLCSLIVISLSGGGYL